MWAIVSLLRDNYEFAMITYHITKTKLLQVKTRREKLSMVKTLSTVL